MYVDICAFNRFFTISLLVTTYCNPEGDFVAVAFIALKDATFSAFTVTNFSSTSFRFWASISACFFCFSAAISACNFLAASFLGAWILSFSSFLLKYSAKTFSSLNFYASFPFLIIITELITSPCAILSTTS